MIKLLVSIAGRVQHTNILYDVWKTWKSLIDKMCYWLLKDDINIRLIKLLNSELENKNIALIGNSPIIINWNKWKEIDWHDTVIRINEWILDLDKTKADTWIKTDIYSTYPMDTLLSKDVRLEIKRKIDKIIVPIPYKSKIMWSTNIFYMQNLRDFNSKELFFIDERLFIEMIKILKWNIPSTWFTLFYYLYNYINFKKLSLYWFSFDCHNRIYNQKMPTGNIHDFSKEKEFILWLIDNKKNIDIFT